MTKKKIIVLINISIIALISVFNIHKCTKIKRDSTNVKIIKISRLEQQLFKCKTKEEILEVLNQNVEIVERLLKLKPEETMENVADRMQKMIANKTMQDLYHEVQNQFYEIEEIENNLNTAFIAIKKLYPEITIPKIATFITGLGVEFYIDKDLIVIGLDYFLGPESKYQPSNTPKYLMHTYNRGCIVPKILLIYVQQFIEDDFTDKTMLSEMVFYGKAFFFVKTILPKIQENIMMSYTVDQLNEVEEVEDIIWEHFMRNKLLFSKNTLLNLDYLNFRNATTEIAPTCPGAIGRWMGYKIVKSYMKNNSNISVVELMKNKNAGQIFSDSHYKPFK